MKIDKKKLIEIINQELDMMQSPNVGHADRQVDDAEGKMAVNQLKQIAKYSIEIQQMLEPYGDEMQLEGWVQNKLTIANDYISKVKHYLENELNAGMEPEGV
tara:strand:- start:2250 stop:2555 length:306 start_codon:yes stop_codon:yes gene_type:complete